MRDSTGSPRGGPGGGGVSRPRGTRGHGPSRLGSPPARDGPRAPARRPAPLPPPPPRPPRAVLGGRGARTKYCLRRPRLGVPATRWVRPRCRGRGGGAGQRGPLGGGLGGAPPTVGALGPPRLSPRRYRTPLGSRRRYPD